MSAAYIGTALLELHKLGPLLASKPPVSTASAADDAEPASSAAAVSPTTPARRTKRGRAKSSDKKTLKKTLEKTAAQKARAAILRAAGEHAASGRACPSSL